MLYPGLLLILCCTSRAVAIFSWGIRPNTGSLTAFRTSKGCCGSLLIFSAALSTCYCVPWTGLPGRPWGISLNALSATGPQGVTSGQQSHPIPTGRIGPDTAHDLVVSLRLDDEARVRLSRNTRRLRTRCLLRMRVDATPNTSRLLRTKKQQVAKTGRSRNFLAPSSPTTKPELSVGGLFETRA